MTNETPVSPVVSIVLATLNEGRNLPLVVERIRQQTLPAFEVVVVDDGSTDGTREFLQRIARDDPRVRYLFHEGKQTTLRAHCQGIEATRGRYVVVMDADLQHPPEILPTLVEKLEEGAGLCVASRYVSGGSTGSRAAIRGIYSRGAHEIARAFLPPTRRVTDPVSGYFAFRRDLWVPINSSYRGYKILLFVLVMTEHAPVAEVGYLFEDRTEGATKVAQGWAFIRMFLIEVLLARRLRAEIARGPRRSSAEQPL